MAEARLYRAGELLQKVWFAYQEETYEGSFGVLRWESPREMVVKTTADAIKRRPGSMISLFPDHICAGPHDKIILLNLFACCLALYHMEGIVEWMLQGLYRSIEQVAFSIQSPPLKVTQEFDSGSPIDNTCCAHAVYKVTLECGKVYALDLTGAQYGWFDPVCTWEELLENRCVKGSFLRNTYVFDAPELAKGSFTASNEPRMGNYRATTLQHFYKGMMEVTKDMQPTQALSLSEGRWQDFGHNLVREIRAQAVKATINADQEWEEVFDSLESSTVEERYKASLAVQVTEAETAGIPCLVRTVTPVAELE